MNWGVALGVSELTPVNIMDIRLAGLAVHNNFRIREEHAERALVGGDPCPIFLYNLLNGLLPLSREAITSRTPSST